MRRRVFYYGLCLGSLVAACQDAADPPGDTLITPQANAGAGGCVGIGCAGGAGASANSATGAGASASAAGSSGARASQGGEGGSSATAQAGAGAGGAAAQAGGGGAAGGASDAGWENIITAEWELAAGEERYFCQRVTLKEDLYFTAVQAINPPGTHHTALTAAASAMRPDGLTECNSSGLAPQGIFGSGVGTDPVTYPDGVGLRLRAGQQLLLNLHVYNVTDKPLRGLSGTAVRRATASQVVNVAESLLAGPARFSLPPGRTSVNGKCTMSHDVTLFAVQPHMHQTGVHMKSIAHSSMAGDVMLHDGAYDFESQLVYSIDEVKLKKGDVIDVECTFDNQTTGTISFGESSEQEMCFLVLHRYPAAAQPSISCFF